MDYQEKIALRKWANMQILDKLKELFEQHPDIRFCQMLSILDVIDGDIWNEESIDTLKHITNKKI